MNDFTILQCRIILFMTVKTEAPNYKTVFYKKIISIRYSSIISSKSFFNENTPINGIFFKSTARKQFFIISTGRIILFYIYVESVRNYIGNSCMCHLNLCAVNRKNRCPHRNADYDIYQKRIKWKYCDSHKYKNTSSGTLSCIKKSHNRRQEDSCCQIRKSWASLFYHL